MSQRALLNEGVFTSRTDEWSTPPAMFDALNVEFAFTLDPCCAIGNATCPRFYTLADDGLSKSWTGERVFMNPPYSDASAWMAKALRESVAGALVVALIPARTDTDWWHEYAMKASEIRFVRGRLRFGGENAIANAPFPSAIVIFRPLVTPGPALCAMLRPSTTGQLSWVP